PASIRRSREVLMRHEKATVVSRSPSSDNVPPAHCTSREGRGDIAGGSGARTGTALNSRKRQESRSWSGALPAILCALAGVTAGTIAAASGTYYVDIDNPACSNTGPGTESVPYCSIGPAAAARGGPDTTILVKPGIY